MTSSLTTAEQSRLDPNIPLKYCISNQWHKTSILSSQIIAPILTDIYNKCVESGSYPDILEIAQVVPIHKNGPKDQCCNYRPISLLSPFTKIFKKCLHDRLHSLPISLNIKFFFLSNLVSKKKAQLQMQFENFLMKWLKIPTTDNKIATCSVFWTLKKHLTL